MNRETMVRTTAQPETRGRNFYHADPSLRGVLALYLPTAELAHLTPHLERLGGLVGARLDDLAGTADRNPPVLHHRDRTGEDRQRIEKHPAYQEMERLAFGELALSVMSIVPRWGGRGRCPACRNTRSPICSRNPSSGSCARST
jgi:acyl-CoA dehydrogenase